jgi:isoamylase
MSALAVGKAHPALSQPSFYTGALNEHGVPDITWHGTQLNSPGFDDPQRRALACTIAGFRDAGDLHVLWRCRRR